MYILLYVVSIEYPLKSFLLNLYFIFQILFIYFLFFVVSIFNLCEINACEHVW